MVLVGKSKDKRERKERRISWDEPVAARCSASEEQLERLNQPLQLRGAKAGYRCLCKWKRRERFRRAKRQRKLVKVSSPGTIGSGEE